MFRQLILATSILAALAATAAAQSKTNFSGTWTLNVSKSDFGLIPGPTSRTDVIEHNDPALKDTVTQDSAQGNQTFALSYTTDGKEVTNQQGPLSVKSTLAWQGADLVVNSKTNFNDNDITLKSVWTLSADGSTLTENVHYTTPMGETDQKLVFDKGAGGAAVGAVAKAPAAAATSATNGAHANYTGTWKLNLAKSDFGIAPPSNNRTDVIDHTDPALKVHTTDDGAQGLQDYTLNMTTDGKEATNQVGGGIEVKNTASWEGPSLVVGSALDVQGTQITAKATWVLSPDGKTLTQNAHVVAGPIGEFDQKLVFDKQ